MWKPMCDAPRDGTPIIVCHNDASGVFVVAFLVVGGDAGWWECESDEYPQPLPHSIDDNFAAAWVPFPDGLKAKAAKFVFEQYGCSATE